MLQKKIKSYLTHAHMNGAKLIIHKYVKGVQKLFQLFLNSLIKKKIEKNGGLTPSKTRCSKGTATGDKRIRAASPNQDAT